MMQELWHSSSFSNILISFPRHFHYTTNEVISICSLRMPQPHAALWSFATFTPIPNGSKTAASEVLKMITTTLAATPFHRADNLAIEFARDSMTKRSPAKSPCHRKSLFAFISRSSRMSSRTKMFASEFRKKLDMWHIERSQPTCWPLIEWIPPHNKSGRKICFSSQQNAKRRRKCSSWSGREICLLLPVSILLFLFRAVVNDLAPVSLSRHTLDKTF